MSLSFLHKKRLSLGKKNKDDKRKNNNCDIIPEKYRKLIEEYESLYNRKHNKKIKRNSLPEGKKIKTSDSISLEQFEQKIKNNKHLLPLHKLILLAKISQLREKIKSRE